MLAARIVGVDLAALQIGDLSAALGRFDFEYFVVEFCADHLTLDVSRSGGGARDGLVLNDLLRHPIGFLLVTVAHGANGQFGLCAAGAIVRAALCAALLHDVRQLVREEFLTIGVTWLIVAFAKVDVVA